MDQPSHLRSAFGKGRDAVWDWFETALKNGPIFLFGVIFVLLAYLVNVPSLPDRLIEVVFRDLGIALIIAYAITIGIEQRSRSQQNTIVRDAIDGTMESMFQRIYDVEFPSNMFSFVREKLMREPFYREDTYISYTL